jgi:hypothetical protein
VIAGLVYNNLRPLDMAANKEPGARIRGSINLLSRQEEVVPNQLFLLIMSKLISIFKDVLGALLKSFVDSQVSIEHIADASRMIWKFSKLFWMN